jgi:lipoyl(octanoyl) transferase
VNPDLSAYDQIIPCGIVDAGVTSIAKELGREIKIEDVLPLVEKHLLPALDRVTADRVTV